MGVKSSGGLLQGLGVVDGPVDADRLFALLHGREVLIRGRRWRLEVYGISDLASGRWVQVGLNGLPRHMVTVRVSAGDGVPAVVRLISAWLASPSQRSVSIASAASSSALRLTSSQACS